METSNRYIYILAFVLFLSIAEVKVIKGAGECGKSSPDAEAMKLIPCANAAMDEKVTPTGACCSRVKKLGQNPACLCAIMLSDTAKGSGVKPEIALTISKRCNFDDRHVGYKCGPYTFP